MQHIYKCHVTCRLRTKSCEWCVLHHCLGFRTWPPIVRMANNVWCLSFGTIKSHTSKQQQWQVVHEMLCRCSETLKEWMTSERCSFSRSTIPSFRQRACKTKLAIKAKQIPWRWFFFTGHPRGNGWKWNGNPNRIHVESIGIPLLALNCGYTKSIGVLDDRTKTRMIVIEIASLELA